MKKVKIKSGKELLPLIQSGKLEYSVSDCGEFGSLQYSPRGEEGPTYIFPFIFGEEVVVVDHHHKTINENMFEAVRELFE